jgi:hypothetical protein
MGKRTVQSTLVYKNNCKGVYKLNGVKYKKGETIPDEVIELMEKEIPGFIKAEKMAGNIKEVKV